MTIRRRGIAPLELVMVLPILASLTALMMWVARVGDGQTAALAEARGGAWAKRGEAAPGEVLRFDHSPAASGVAAHGVNRPYGNRPTAEAVAHFRPWAFEDVPFDPLPDGEIAVHEEFLKQLAEGNPGSLTAFARLLDGLRASRAIDPAKR